MAQGYTNYIADDRSRASLLNDISVTSRIFGGPFIYTDAVDPALNVGAASGGNQIMGRMTAQRIMHDPTIISLCPGKVNFLVVLDPMVRKDCTIMSLTVLEILEVFLKIHSEMIKCYLHLSKIIAIT